MVVRFAGLLLLNISLSAASFNCTVTDAGWPTVRLTGVAEKTGEILLICIGGSAGQQREFDITVSLSVPVMNPSPSGNKSDALLFVDEPMVANQVAGQNVFVGEFEAPAAGATVAHTIRFRGVKIVEPGDAQSRVVRITNIRGNASAVPYSGQNTPFIFAKVDSSPGITGVPATIATAIRSQATLSSIVEASQTAGYQLQVRVQEPGSSEFRRRRPSSQGQPVLGVVNQTESGYISNLFQSSGVTDAGLANSGTKIVLKFSNVPPGQQVFVSTRPIALINSGLDLRLTETGDQGGAAPFAEVVPTSGLPSPGIAPVAIANGQGMAVYEVIETDTTTVEWATLGIVLAGGSGSPTVQAMFGPLTDSPQAWVPRFTAPRTAPAVVPAAVFRDTFHRIRLIEYGSSEIHNAGGVFSGKPGAAQDGDGNTWIVARDTSSGLYITRFRAASKTFDNWIFLGGLAKGDPSVTVSLAGIVYYTIRDNWNNCWLGTFRPGIGNTWRRVGGVFATDPQTSVTPGDDIWIAGKDLWNGIWTTTIPEGPNVHPPEIPWTFRGGLVQGQIALSRFGDVPLLAARDFSNALWFATMSRNTFTWASGQGLMSRDPQVAGTTAVVAINDSISVREYGSPWVATGGVLSSESAASLNNELYIAGRDASNQIWWYRSSTGQWTFAGHQGVAASELSAVPR